MKKLDKIKLQIRPILIKNNVSRLSVFGSYARGNENKKSDLDLLVSFDQEKSLMDFIGLKIELEKKLKLNIDLLTYDSISPFLKENIKKDEILIYG
jgi:uncharacterized protein